MSEQHILPQRNFIRPVLISTLIFLVVSLTTAGAILWWKSTQGPVTLTEEEHQAIEQRVEEARYQPGEKSFALSERELNGLLNFHTTLGDEVQIELEKGAVHARVKTTLNQDVPVLGGKTVHAKARFLVETDTPFPSLILDDLTLYGISLPNAWLADLKGKNLLASINPSMTDNFFARGIEEIKLKQGFIEIQLAE